MDEDLALELEALQAVYAEDLAVDGSALRLQLKPYTAQDLAQQFVQATLCLALPPDYPRAPLELQLEAVKGLSEEGQAQLLSSLRKQALDLVGEPALGALCEVAKDLITAQNLPGGDCPICLSALSGASMAEETVVKLPCWHCLHRSCFVRWWGFSQLHKAALAQQTKLERGAQAGEKLRELGLICDEEGAYSVLCPACRSLVLPGEAPALEPGESQREEALSDTAGTGFSLSREQTEALRERQRWNERQLKVQRDKGGLVDARWGVSVQ